MTAIAPRAGGHPADTTGNVRDSTCATLDTRVTSAPMAHTDPTFTWRGLTVRYEFDRSRGCVGDTELVDWDPAELLLAFGQGHATPGILFARYGEAIEAAILREEERLARENEDFAE